METQRPDPTAVRRLMKLAGVSPGGEASDRELIERFIMDRSDGAFADLMARHGPMVLAVCRRHLRDPHAAEDAFQAAFLVLARKAGQVRWRESIGGWLFEVATRVAWKAACQAARRTAREGTSTDLEPTAPVSPPAADLTALQTALDEELGRLPEKLRAPVVLCHLEGLSQEEVARHLGVTDGQLRGRLYRAKEKLRERLVRRGFSLSAVLLSLSVGATARAVPAAVATTAARLAKAHPSTIPVAVDQLAQAVIRETTMTFKFLTVLTILGVLALAGAGYAVHRTADTPLPPPERAGAEPAQTTPKPVGAQPTKPDEKQAPRPEIFEDAQGTINSVDPANNKLLVDFDRASGKGEDAGITAETKLFFARWTAKLGEFKPGMRVHVIYYKDSKNPKVPDEVRASWPVLRPNVTGEDIVWMKVTFEVEGEHGIPLEVTLPIAPDMRPTLDGKPSRFHPIPHGRASWLSLSPDRKQVIGVASFTDAYDVSGAVVDYDARKRLLTVTTGPDGRLTAPVAANVQVMVDGEDATLADVKKWMRVLIRRSADGKSITGVVAVSNRVALPEPARQ